MIELADWPDILSILRETHQIWSPGLSRTDYHRYIWGQMTHSWARKNYRYVALKENGRVLSSCKLYTMSLQSKGRDYSALGIGAVYTQQFAVGTGCASRMLKAVRDLALRENRDLLLLYSDIGHEFYKRLGFEATQHDDFHMYLDERADRENPAKANLALETAQRSKLKPAVRPIEADDAEAVVRHHRRWLRRQPYGIARDPEYWRYKLWRELFLHGHSAWSWPRLELVRLPNGTPAHAIIEQAAATLRVLEVIGDEPARDELWTHLLWIAIERGSRRIRGWAASRPQTFSPAINQREWGLPMILPLNPQVRGWLDADQCPLLELEHI